MYASASAEEIDDEGELDEPEPKDGIDNEGRLQERKDKNGIENQEELEEDVAREGRGDDEELDDRGAREGLDDEEELDKRSSKDGIAKEEELDESANEGAASNASDSSNFCFFRDCLGLDAFLFSGGIDQPFSTDIARIWYPQFSYCPPIGSMVIEMELRPSCK